MSVRIKRGCAILNLVNEVTIHYTRVSQTVGPVKKFWGRETNWLFVLCAAKLRIPGVLQNFLKKLL